MIVGADEAVNALAEWHSGSIEAFTQAMNDRAAALGMADTLFASPAGVRGPQRTTAADALVLARHMLDRHSKLVRFSAEPWFEWNGKRRLNTNGLLRRIEGACGLKTGVLGGRLFNAVLVVECGGACRIAVVLGARSVPERDHSIDQILQSGLIRYG
jgi:D-alanyl-D-alanine carboxypeptidase